MHLTCIGKNMSDGTLINALLMVLLRLDGDKFLGVKCRAKRSLRQGKSNLDDISWPSGILLLSNKMMLSARARSEGKYFEAFVREA